MANRKGTVTRDDLMKLLDDNEFVEDLDLKRLKIIYSKSFYIVMAKLMKNGKSPLEAYEACGFSVEKLGENRAYAAAQKAKEIASKPDYGLDPEDYDGSVPRELMGDLTPEELVAYNQARVYYLERALEAQKKIPLILEELLTSSQKKQK